MLLSPVTTAKRAISISSTRAETRPTNQGWSRGCCHTVASVSSDKARTTNNKCSKRRKINKIEISASATINPKIFTAVTPDITLGFMQNK